MSLDSWQGYSIEQLNQTVVVSASAYDSRSVDSVCKSLENQNQPYVLLISEEQSSSPSGSTPRSGKTLGEYLNSKILDDPEPEVQDPLRLIGNCSRLIALSDGAEFGRSTLTHIGMAYVFKRKISVMTLRRSDVFLAVQSFGNLLPVGFIIDDGPLRDRKVA